MGEARVAIVCGGVGAEGDVSFRAADFVAAMLSHRGHEHWPVFCDRDLDRALRKTAPDVAFVALLGRAGEEGIAQGVLELLRIPFTGPSLRVCAIASSRVTAKALLRQHNLPVPAHYMVTARDIPHLLERHGAFGMPVMVKPALGGMSIGVQKVSDADDLHIACLTALRFCDEVIVERWIDGRQLVIATLHGRALGAVETEPAGEWWDFSAKASAKPIFCETSLPPARMAGLLRLAERAVGALGLDGAALCQVVSGIDDMIIGVTALPPILPGSALLACAAQAGFSPDALLGRILEGAVLRGHAARGDRRTGVSARPEARSDAPPRRERRIAGEH